MYLYSVCYATILVIQKRKQLGNCTEQDYIEKMNFYELFFYEFFFFSGGERLKAQRKCSSTGRGEPLGTNSHLTIPGG